MHRRLVVSIFAGIGFLSAQQPANDFFIKHVRVFDGTRVIPESNVWVRNGKIQALGRDLLPPAGVNTIDGSGDTLLPGLIDAHTHSYVRDALRQELIFGVTTELGMENDPRFIAEIKREQAAGTARNLADMRSAGWPATAPGGHGAEGGVPVPTLTSSDQAQAFVNARVKEGSDYLKIIDEDGSLWNLHTPHLTKEIIAALVRAAHKDGLMTIAHIGNEPEAYEVIDAGVDGLAHLFVDRAPDPHFGPFVAKHHAFVVPTLTVLESVAGVPSGESLVNDARLRPYLTSQAIGSLTKTVPLKLARPAKLEYALKTERDLLAARVPVLAGTDAPNPGTWFGVSMHRELELLVRGGMSPVQALQSATSVPAFIFHLGDRGRIAPGLRADLLLVQGDPCTNIANTRAILAVWKQGLPVDRELFKSEVAQSQAREQALRRAAPPPGSDSGFVSDFENGKPTAAFGAGWSVTIGYQGGKSTASMKIVDGGANSSRYSLEVSGEIVSDVRYPVAGAMFSPGAKPFAPANLSSHKTLSFWVKGDGRTYQLMVPTAAGGGVPAIQPFVAGPDWRHVAFSFSSLGNSDGYDITGFQFVAGPDAGKFRFQLDDLKLE
ncbi:MAG: CIA30 family protein [Acidobacteriia bacterium]|nr:CIA30 family protein [Terriglobia bacterium]